LSQTLHYFIATNKDNVETTGNVIKFDAIIKCNLWMSKLVPVLLLNTGTILLRRRDLLQEFPKRYLM
jgi:cytochrome b subunit of formate dehydrogenase